MRPLVLPVRGVRLDRHDNEQESAPFRRALTREIA